MSEEGPKVVKAVVVEEDPEKAPAAEETPVVVEKTEGEEMPREEEEKERRVLPYESVVHGENARVADDADAFFVFKVATTYRRSCCVTLGLINLFWLVLTLALGFGGYNVINTENLGEVGLVRYQM